MKLKKFATLSLTGSAIAILSTSCANPGSAIFGDLIEPGEIGILIDLYGGDKGIDSATLVSSGKQQYNTQTQRLVIFPTTIRSYPFTAEVNEGDPRKEDITFTVENVQVSMDVGVAFGFSTAPVPGRDKEYTYLHQFYSKYKLSPDDFRSTLLYQGLRDCAQQTASSQQVKSVIDLQNNPIQFLTGAGGVKECIQKKFPELIISDVNVLGQVRIPEAQQQAANAVSLAKQEAQQAKFAAEKARAEGLTLVAQKQAEADARVTEAKGKAKALTIEANAFTPAAQALVDSQIRKIKAERWAPVVVQTTNTQVAQPQQE